MGNDLTWNQALHGVVLIMLVDYSFDVSRYPNAYHPGDFNFYLTLVKCSSKQIFVEVKIS